MSYSNSHSLEIDPKDWPDGTKVSERKPCPFCGSPLTYHGECETGPMVCCQSCEASGPIARHDSFDDRDANHEDANLLWNNRQADEEIKELQIQIHKARIDMRQKDEYASRIYEDWKSIQADRSIVQYQLEKWSERALKDEQHLAALVDACKDALTFLVCPPSKAVYEGIFQTLDQAIKSVEGENNGRSAEMV